MMLTPDYIVGLEVYEKSSTGNQECINIGLAEYGKSVRSVSTEKVEIPLIAGWERAIELNELNPSHQESRE